MSSQVPTSGDQRGIRYDNVTAGSWTAPFVMAMVNTRVVRRTHALLGYPWGKSFSYHEAIQHLCRTGWLDQGCNAITGGLTMLFTMASFGWTRYLLERFVLPKPGTGPDRKARESGFFNLRQVGALPDGRRYSRQNHRRPRPGLWLDEQDARRECGLPGIRRSRHPREAS